MHVARVMDKWESLMEIVKTTKRNRGRRHIHDVQVLSEQIISNESRIAKTKVILNFNKPRQMQFTFLVRYEDFSKIEAICSDMKDHLHNTEGIHRQLPMWVGFTGVEGNACNVYTIVSCHFHSSSKKCCLHCLPGLQICVAAHSGCIIATCFKC